MNQQIAECSKDVSRHPNFKRDELEKMLTAIIGETSKKDVTFRIKVEQYTESTKPAKETTIAVWLDKARSVIVVQIQLFGFIEKWKVDVCLKKDLQKNPSTFLVDMENAAKAVCTEENKKHSSLDRKKEVAPVQKTEEPGVGTTCVVATTVPQPKEKKRRRKTASFITNEVILEILESWMKRGKRIHQAELWSIISKLCITINRISVLRLLQKKSLVDVIQIKQQRPQVEIAQLGLDLLSGQQKQVAEEELKTKKKEQLQKMLDYPKIALTQLKKLQSLQSEYAQLEQIKVEKETGIKRIADLQAEINQQKEGLIRIEAMERKQLKEIKRLLALIDPNKLAGLIEIAEKSVRQKTEA